MFIENRIASKDIRDSSTENLIEWKIPWSDSIDHSEGIILIFMSGPIFGLDLIRKE